MGVILTQIVQITGAPGGGTFTLTCNGATTGNIAYNASPQTVQTALAALTGCGAILVAGVNPYFLVVNAPTAITGNPASLTGGTSPAIAVSYLANQSPAKTLGQKFAPNPGGPSYNWDTAASSNNTYSTGQNVGSTLFFPNVVDPGATQGSVIAGILLDTIKQNKETELWLFNAAPTATYTDNAAFTPSEADLLTLVGVLDFATFKATANIGVSTLNTLEIPFSTPDNSPHLWGQLVTRSTPTFTGAGQLIVGIANSKG